MLQDFQDFQDFYPTFWTQKAINSPYVQGVLVCLRVFGVNARFYDMACVCVWCVFVCLVGEGVRVWVLECRCIGASLID